MSSTKPQPLGEAMDEALQALTKDYPDDGFLFESIRGRAQKLLDEAQGKGSLTPAALDEICANLDRFIRGMVTSDDLPEPVVATINEQRRSIKEGLLARNIEGLEEPEPLEAVLAQARDQLLEKYPEDPEAILLMVETLCLKLQDFFTENSEFSEANLSALCDLVQNWIRWKNLIPGMAADIQYHCDSIKDRWRAGTLRWGAPNALPPLDLAFWMKRLADLKVQVSGDRLGAALGMTSGKASDNPQDWYRLGYLHEACGGTLAAMEAYKRAVGLQSAQGDSYVSIDDRISSDAMTGYKRMAERLAARHPRKAEYWNEVGQAHEALGPVGLMGACLAYETSLRLNPSRTNAKGREDMKEFLRERPEWIDSFKRWVWANSRGHPEDNPIVERWNLLGDLYESIRWYEEAKDAYERSLLVPTNENLVAQEGLGRMILKTNGGRPQPSSALGKAREAIREDSNPANWTALGQAYEEAGREHEAFYAYFYACELNQFRFSDIGEAYHGCRRLIIQVKEAVKIMRLLAKSFPSHARWNTVAHLYELLDDETEAAVAFAAAAQPEPPVLPLPRPRKHEKA